MAIFHSRMLAVLLFGPGVRFVPEVVWRSKFFWIALVLMIAGSVFFHNLKLKKMEKGSFVNRLFRLFSAVKNPGGARISYSSDGRSGHVHYQSAESDFAMYYEFGGGNCVASIDIPSAENWEKTTQLPLDRRDEVLNFIGRRVVQDQTTGGRGYFKIEGDWLSIYI